MRFHRTSKNIASDTMLSLNYRPFDVKLHITGIWGLAHRLAGPAVTNWKANACACTWINMLWRWSAMQLWNCGARPAFCSNLSMKTLRGRCCNRWASHAPHRWVPQGVGQLVGQFEPSAPVPIVRLIKSAIASTTLLFSVAFAQIIATRRSFTTTKRYADVYTKQTRSIVSAKWIFI